MSLLSLPITVVLLLLVNVLGIHTLPSAAPEPTATVQETPERTQSADRILPKERLSPDTMELVDVHSSAVVQWNQLFLHTIASEHISPPEAARLLAIMHRCVYDALLRMPHEFDAESVVHLTAQRIYREAFPHYSLTLGDTEAIPADAPVRTYAVHMAEQQLQARQDDGSTAVADYQIIDEPGLWRATPPYFADPLLPHWGSVALFAASSTHIILPAPPTLLSDTYSEEYAEVKQLGGATSNSRTTEQAEIAKFWADGKGTYTPPGHWNVIAQAVLRTHDWPLREQARVFAVLNTALADAGIGAWHNKFLYNYWRPIDAIHHADLDGNPLTSADQTWTNYIETPNFPEYPSGHSAFSGAGATVLAHFFGDDISFSSYSLGLPGVERSFTSFSDAAHEAGLSRIYGGIHFQSANVQGLSLGERVATAAIAAFPTEVQ